MYTLYKHTSPNGKVYIGITSKTVNERWRNGNGYNHSPHFNMAIKKYGWKNIKHEIIETNLTKEEAEKKEIRLIKFYDSTNPKNGYNCDSGGNVNRCHTEETKEKIRKSHIGMKYDDEFKKKISESKKGNKNRLGKKFSEEVRLSLSAKHKGKTAGEKNYFYGKHFYGALNPMSKPVIRYSLTGEYIDERDCASQYARELKISNATHIVEVCKGKRKTAYGYIWKYKEAV